MIKQTLLTAALLAAMAGAHAQAPTASAPAPATPASAAAPSSPAKKQLVQKLLKMQQPSIEGMARQLTEQPAAQMLQQAAIALQRMPADQREAAAKDIQAEAKKYSESTVPLVSKRAVDLTPATIGKALEDNFSEAELKQLIAIFESLQSPVNRKFQQLGPSMQKSLGEKLVPEMRGTVEPKLRELEQAIGKRLGLVPPTAGSAPAANGAAPPPSTPAPQK
jgi:hypothetical protein